MQNLADENSVAAEKEVSVDLLEIPGPPVVEMKPNSEVDQHVSEGANVDSAKDVDTEELACCLKTSNEVNTKPGPSSSSSDDHSIINNKRKIEAETSLPLASTTKRFKIRSENMSQTIRKKLEEDFYYDAVTQIGEVKTKVKDDTILIVESDACATPPDHQVFTVELAMLEILKNLTVDELILCRLVNSYFAIFATQLLRRCRAYKIKLKFDWSLKKYIKLSKFESDHNTAVQATLESLTEFMKYRPNFPCNSFSFKAGSLCTLDLQEFLTIHGTHVKSLAVEVYCPPSPPCPTSIFAINYYPMIYTLRDLLVNQVPNVENLHLKKLPLSWETSTERMLALEWKNHLINEDPNKIEKKIENQKQICFPNLKRVILHNNTPVHIVKDIINAGVNLQEIFKYARVGPVLGAKKFHLFRSLAWMPRLEDIEECEKYLFEPKAVTKCQLTILYMSAVHAWNPDFWPRISRVFQTVLEKSAPTLKVFGFISSMGFLSDLDFPELSNVVGVLIGLPKLPHFKYTTWGTKQVFPPGFQLNKSFPKLTWVNLFLGHLRRNGTSIWQNFFDSTLEPVPSVNCLSFEKCSRIPMAWMGYFQELFPNVTILFINTKYFNFVDACRTGLWKFVKLQQLSIEINLGLKTVNVNDGINAIRAYDWPALECCFTGFSGENVGTLKDDAIFDFEDVEEMRERDSIVNCKDLRQLCMTFVDESQEVRGSYTTLMTHVTGQFAFQMCPYLEVKVKYRIRQPQNIIALSTALDLVLPYIRYSPFFKAGAGKIKNRPSRSQPDKSVSKARTFKRR